MEDETSALTANHRAYAKEVLVTVSSIMMLVSTIRRLQPRSRWALLIAVSLAACEPESAAPDAGPDARAAVTATPLALDIGEDVSAVMLGVDAAPATTALAYRVDSRVAWLRPVTARGTFTGALVTMLEVDRTGLSAGEHATGTFVVVERVFPSPDTVLEWRAKHDRGLGVVTFVMEPNGTEQSAAYDALGRLTTIIVGTAGWNALELLLVERSAPIQGAVLSAYRDVRAD